MISQRTLALLTILVSANIGLGVLLISVISPKKRDIVPWRFNKVVLCITIIYLLNIVLILLYINGFKTHIIYYLIIYYLHFMELLIIVSLFYKYPKESFRITFTQGKYILWSINIFLICSGLIIMLSIIRIYLHLPPYKSLLGSMNWVYRLIIVGLFAPFVEELLFRGILIQSLEERMKTSMAVIFSGMLFAGFHFNLVYAMGYWILGIILGLLFVKSRSLIPPLIFHCLWNISIAMGIFSKLFFK